MILLPVGLFNDHIRLPNMLGALLSGTPQRGVMGPRAQL